MQSNAIAREIAKLDEQWEDFIASQQPLLRWTFHPHDLQLARGFIRFKEQLDESSPELYLELHSEFSAADSFGYRLADEFNEQVASNIAQAFASTRDTPDANDALTQWRTPSLAGCDSGHAAFIRSLVHTLHCFEDYIHYLVVFITPNQVGDAEAYAKWWQTCCDIGQRYEWPKALKLVVFDTETESPLASVSRANPDKFLSLVAPVHFRRALNAILEETDDGSPAAAFRKFNLQLQQAVGDRHASKMQEAAAGALTIAQRERWIDMAIVVALTRAAGLIGLNQHDDALADYRLAQTWASAGITEKIAGCDKLRVQACMGEATCLFSIERDLDASRSYQQAALYAQEINDQFLELEGWRMASYCLERAQQKDIAWEMGLKALGVGDAMEPTTRENSTLPFVGQALLRLSPNRETDAKIRARFAQLLGPDWQEKMDAAYASE